MEAMTEVKGIFLPSFCPNRHAKKGELMPCERMEKTGCRECINEHVDRGTI